MSEMKDFNLPTEREMPQEKWLFQTDGKDAIQDVAEFCLDNGISYRVDVKDGGFPFTFFVTCTMEKYEKVFDALEDILES
jgi:hypothetical protein